MSTIRVVGSTMGVSTPATAGDGHAKPYRWRGHENWTPNHPDYREHGPALSGPSLHNARESASRRERLAEFASYLEQGLTVPQAAKLLKIALKTAKTYARELGERQLGEDCDG